VNSATLTEVQPAVVEESTPSAVLIDPPSSALLQPEPEATRPAVLPSPAQLNRQRLAQADDFGMACKPPTESVMAWLRQTGHPELPESDVAMVFASPGNNPDEDWWVVAAVSASDAWGGIDRVSGMARNDVSFLTNAPDDEKPTQDRWIDVGRPLLARRGVVDWSAVRWPDERIERGQAAQAKALSCLPNSTLVLD